MILTFDNQIHGLEDGDQIEFREVVGMTALNGTTQSVKGSYIYEEVWPKACGWNTIFIDVYIK